MILDIETVAVDGIAIEPVTPPSNYTTDEAIARYVAKAEASQREKAALYPWTCKVIAAGWCEEGNTAVEVATADGVLSEQTLLKRVWEAYHRCGQRLVGFNHRAFDLPVLMARSILLGVPYPTMDIDKYRSPHPDVMLALTFKGAIPARSLRWYADRFGLNTDDAFSGREIATLYEDGNWEAIRKHVESDITLTRQLAERLQICKAPIRPAGVPA